MNKFKIIIIFLFIFYVICIKSYFKSGIIVKTVKQDNYKNVFNNSIIYNEFDEKINEKYIYLQKLFCKNQNENLEELIENNIKLAHVDFNGNNFDMFVYKNKDYVSDKIFLTHQWEAGNTNKIIKALDYYSKKKKLDNKDIYMLDIGANIGWFTFFFGKYGYKIISFEASKINNYILYKNYCLNKDINVTIINKGLDIEEQNCKLINVKSNIGDGAIFCKNREKPNNLFDGEIFNDIKLTKLSKYINFFSDKNLALMKLDVEGAEGNVIFGGKEIINKYHIPFILMEFQINLLETHGTKVKEFLEFFENNGYKFSKIDFLNKKYISSSQIIKMKKNMDLFAIHNKIFS